MPRTPSEIGSINELLANGAELAIAAEDWPRMKAARALSGWSQENLAARAGVSLPTVKRLEAVRGVLGVRTETSHSQSFDQGVSATEVRSVIRWSQ